MTIKDYIAYIVDNGKQEDMEQLSSMLDEIICKTKEHHRDMYDHYKMRLYELAYGHVVNSEIGEEWVREMKPIGKHWTIDETNAAMSSLGYKFDKNSFYIVANMMYNDYYNIVKDDDTLALKMAHDWLSDEDAKEDKLYCYWKHVVKRD